jgi:hypothetical protein
MKTHSNSATINISKPNAYRMSKSWCKGPLLILCTLMAQGSLSGQNVQPYPNAITDKLVHTKTPMTLPMVNVPFVDPDFGSQMVRVTDESSQFLHRGRYLRTEASGSANMWSSDSSKFYVIGEGGVTLAFSFDPLTMNIGSLPGATPGQALLVPLRIGGSFSFTDPDLMYGTNHANALEITSYRFSTGTLSPVIDTTKCGVQPPLIPGPQVISDDDVTPSLDDNRLSISEGGSSVGNHMFVVVYDKSLGCRWYNTQTGQIGGQWGPTGRVSTGDSFLIAHATLSRSGNYVRISAYGLGWYVWDVATLQVTHCPIHSEMRCAGYTATGYNTVIQARADQNLMNVVKRPFSDVTQVTPLVWPLEPMHSFPQGRHFTWSNVDVNDSVPVCVSTYDSIDKDDITVPYEGEIFCIETDGAASTIWRFAHNRAHWYPGHFNTQPLGSISRDGQFFLFTSSWDEQVGLEANGTPRSDVWIVRLQ